MPDPYVTMPTPSRAEGEVDLTATLGDGRDEALLFVQHLARQLLEKIGGSLSAFSIDWAGSASGGRLYGQMWLEREGSSVHFLNGRLIAEDGALIAAYSATVHQVAGSSH